MSAAEFASSNPLGQTIIDGFRAVAQAEADDLSLEEVLDGFVRPEELLEIDLESTAQSRLETIGRAVLARRQKDLWKEDEPDAEYALLDLVQPIAPVGNTATVHTLDGSSAIHIHRKKWTEDGFITERLEDVPSVTGRIDIESYYFYRGTGMTITLPDSGLFGRKKQYASFHVVNGKSEPLVGLRIEIIDPLKPLPESKIIPSQEVRLRP